MLFTQKKKPKQKNEASCLYIVKHPSKLWTKRKLPLKEMKKDTR